MPDVLSHLERRILTKLPVWVADEAALVEAEGGPRRWDEQAEAFTGSIRRYSLAAFTAERVADDPFTVGIDSQTGETRKLTEPEVENMLEILVGRGFASHEDEDGKRYWRMAQAGLAAIDAEPSGLDHIPGPVAVELAPAVADSNAQAME